MNAMEHVMERGCLPKLGDDPPPWSYPGWLLLYVQGAEHHINGENSRWSHYMRTLEAGRLLDEPIPQIHFGHPGKIPDEGAEGHKAIDEWTNIIFHEHGSAGELRALLDWMLYGLGLTKEAPQLSAKTNEALYRAVDVSKLLKHPYDYIGGHYVMSKGNNSKNNRGAFYPTPHHVVDLMTQMTMGDRVVRPGRDPRSETVCDPCVGTGRFLLAASNYSYRLYGMDIDPICVAATKINGALYAPWLTWPLPESFFEGQELVTHLPDEFEVEVEEPDLVLVAEAAPAWQQTADQYLDSQGIIAGRQAIQTGHEEHSRLVYQAVADGETVPAAVLQEYPGAALKPHFLPETKPFARVGKPAKKLRVDQLQQSLF